MKGYVQIYMEKNYIRGYVHVSDETNGFISIRVKGVYYDSHTAFERSFGPVIMVSGNKTFLKALSDEGFMVSDASRRRMPKRILIEDEILRAVDRYAAAHYPLNRSDTVNIALEKKLGNASFEPGIIKSSGKINTSFNIDRKFLKIIDRTAEKNKKNMLIKTALVSFLKDEGYIGG